MVCLDCRRQRGECNRCFLRRIERWKRDHPVTVDAEAVIVHDEIPDEAILATEPPADELNAPTCMVRQAQYARDLNSFMEGVLR
jgi:hypothetical protein